MHASKATTEIAVIGAGIVGLCVALRLSDDGHDVTLIAPPDDEQGASYGNAGIVADYAVMPVGTPSVLRNLPSLLFDRDSPLAIRKAALLTLAPWLIRFAWNCRASSAQANARAIATLLAHAQPDWRALAERIGGTGGLNARGSLYLHETQAQMRAADYAPYRDLGVEVEHIDRDTLGQLEPGLPRDIGVGAAFFPRTLTLDDPGAMMRLLRGAVDLSPVARIHARVSHARRVPGGVVLAGSGLALKARKVVLAAGAWSRPLALALGARVPLNTERGYHLEYDMDRPPLTRHVTPVARGFYFCPMAGRLRVAGTVELGGLGAPVSPHRLAALERGVRAILPDLPAPSRRWMGCRPSIPDSVPVIGQVRGIPEVIHAYGHGHLGLTLGPVTARMVADMVAGRSSGEGPDPSAYRPDRF